MQHSQKDLKGHLAAWFTVGLWGSTFISTKVLLRSFSPVEILFFRFLLGYIALWFACPRRLKKTTGKQELMFAAAGLSGVTMHYLLENVALNHTLASNVGVLASVAPLFTALFALVFLRDSEHLGSNFFIGFACAIAGIVMISANGEAGTEAGLLGDMLALVSAAAWGVYAILTRKISEWGIDPILMTRHIFAYGLLFMLPALPLMGFDPDPAMLLQPLNIFNLAYLGLGASAACFATWNIAVGELGAVKTSSYLYMAPVITVTASALILHEHMSPMAMGGALLTLLGLILSERKPGRKAKRSKIKAESAAQSKAA